MSSSSASSSRSARNSRRNANSNIAHTVVQIALGTVFFAIWVIVGNQMHNDAIMHGVVSSLPFFILFVLGVLSRHVPGVKAIAKRLASGMPE